MNQVHQYELDLTKIEGEGEFACPKCGATISPEDNTEEVYSILEPIVDSYGLEEVLIRCNKCGIQIHLLGFSFLRTLTEMERTKFSRK